MNIARSLIVSRNHNVGRTLFRKFRLSSSNRKSTPTSQPVAQEEKFDFEDLKVLERVERRKAAIPPFMKDVFVSVFNRDLLAFPEILNKEESEALENRLSALERIFSDPDKNEEDRKKVLKLTSMYAAPVALTDGGLAMNYTESLRYLEAISSDVKLSQQLSDHWVCLRALYFGLTSDQYRQVIDDLTKGDNTISLCIKERVSERVKQADFRTSAELDSQGVWRISGEKYCINQDGYLLVLATFESGRIKAFLVHPNADRVVKNRNGIFVNFHETPATPLDEISEQKLSQVLAVGRLYAATLCRCSLQRAMRACADFVQPRFLAGKPLSEISSIRKPFGETLTDIYASESAEYFTAGILDEYTDPDAEMETAMCRNFIAKRSLSRLTQLLSIPTMERHDECSQITNEMRHLTARGETLDSINVFISLNGIHHAGKMMSEEIKQIRNPLMHPTFIFKKALANRHQEKDDPKLTLYLAEHLHPTLRIPAEQLEYCVLRMRYGAETLMARHGMDVSYAYTDLNRLAEAGTYILAMTASLARASRSYCIGLRNAENEMKLAATFVNFTKDKVKKLIKEIDDGEYLNLDHYTLQFGKKLFDNNFHIENPTARTFW